MENNQLLTTTKVAELLHLNIETVRRLTREGKLKCVKFGRHIRIREKALEEFIKEHEVVK